MADYDVIIIGGGPGGYNGAIRAGQLGLKVACVEKRATLGGTCLNVGCIPSKALLHASELYELANKDFAGFGIEVTPKLNLAAMMKQKGESVDGLTKGVEFLFKKNKVDWGKGAGRLAGEGRVEVTAADGAVTTLSGKAIVIATGSAPAPLTGVEIDQKRIVDSTGALSIPEVPKSLIVIGAGIIGLELGSVWRRLGAAVTVVEFLDHITPGMDGETAKAFQRALIKQGIAFRLSSKVTGAKASADGVALTVEPVAGGVGRLRPGRLERRLGRPARPPRGGHGLGVASRVGVEQLELAGRLAQPPGLVLGRHLEQPLAERLQIGPRAGPAPHERAAAAAREQAPGQHQRFLAGGAQIGHRLQAGVLEEAVGQLELGLDVRLGGVRPDQRAGRGGARQKPDRIGQHRLAGAGLACEHVQAGRRLEVGTLDQGQVLDMQVEQHGSQVWARARTSFRETRSND